MKTDSRALASIPLWLYVVAGVILLMTAALILYGMGRIPVCTCGFGLWTSDTVGSRTSQLFTDPYTSSHFLHGFIFYGIIFLVARRLPLRARALLAMLLEIGWEILENSPLIINRYRAATAAFDYTGDSILNSTGDILFAMLGFWIASRLPLKWTLLVTVAIELIMLAWVRDNLTLNILMLVAPIPAIKAWQMGGSI